MKRRIGQKGTVLLVAAALAATAVAGGALAVFAARGTAAATTAVTVKATESNYKIVLSKTSVPAGSKVTFVVHNSSPIVHKFAIKKPSFLKSIVGSVGPGKTKYLTVTLAKGTYTVFCALHVAYGMKKPFYVGVTPPGTTTHATTTTPTTYTYPTY
jgi:plastocyanin